MNYKLMSKRKKSIYVVFCLLDFSWITLYLWILFVNAGINIHSVDFNKLVAYLKTGFHVVILLHNQFCFLFCPWWTSSSLCSLQCAIQCSVCDVQWLLHCTFHILHKFGISRRYWSWTMLWYRSDCEGESHGLVLRRWIQGSGRWSE